MVYDPDREFSKPVLCGIEGCPRVTLAGHEFRCGLAKIYGLSKAPEHPLCSAVATVAVWESEGLFDD